MPYQTIGELPPAVKKLPRDAQEMWLKVFNSAWDQYDDEGKAAATAWAAVKKKWEKRGERWIKRSIKNTNSLFTSNKIIETEDLMMIPTVFTKEGVQNRALKPREELAKSWRWANSVPVIINHPPGKQSIAAHMDAIIGYTDKAAFRPEDAAITGFVNLYKNKTPPEILDGIRKKQIKEGSVGFWFMPDRTPGVFNGKEYDEIERDILFEHYAISPNVEGACPASEGCGLQLDKQKGDGDVEEKKIASRIVEGIRNAFSLGDSHSDVIESSRDDGVPYTEKQGTVNTMEDKQRIEELEKQLEEVTAERDEAKKNLEEDVKTKEDLQKQLDSLQDKEKTVADLQKRIEDMEKTEADRVQKAKDELVKGIIERTKEKPAFYKDWETEQLKKLNEVLTSEGTVDRSPKAVGIDGKPSGLTVGKFNHDTQKWED